MQGIHNDCGNLGKGELILLKLENNISLCSSILMHDLATSPKTID